MPEQHELELYLLPNTAMSRVLVDGTEVGGVHRVSVVAEVGDVLAVTVESYRLGTPYVLRGQMLVVYDGPAEAAPPAEVRTCAICGTAAPATRRDWYERPQGDLCPACHWTTTQREDTP